jgi:hypothetical protein
LLLFGEILPLNATQCHWFKVSETNKELNLEDPNLLEFVESLQGDIDFSMTQQHLREQGTEN